MFKLGPVLCTLAAAVAVAGCGGSSDKDNIQTTVKNYFNAVADGDGSKACDQLSKSTKASAGGNNCASALTAASKQANISRLKSTLKQAKVGSVKVSGSSATAVITLKGASTSVQLVKENGSWKLQAGASGP